MEKGGRKGEAGVLMPSNIARPDDEDIPRLRRRPLPLQCLVELIHRNLMSGHGTRRQPPHLILPPSQPVDQHTSSNDAAPLTPVVDAIPVAFHRFFVRQPVVVLPSRLVTKVLKRVPLRARLGVDVKLVVHGFEAEGLHEVDLSLGELFAAEARELHIVKRPIQLDMLARVDFAGRGLDDLGREEVDGYARGMLVSAQ